MDPANLIERHQVGVWRYLRALGCEATLADDLTQDTFLAVLRNPIEYYNDSATASYLRRVAFHLLLAHRKLQRRERCADNIELLDNQWIRWAGFDSGEAALEALHDCFERLTERAQKSLRLRFQSRATREQIAGVLKISPDGAKNLMQRTKATLRECIESKLNEYR